jgi:hypothetical protein
MNRPNPRFADERIDAFIDSKPWILRTGTVTARRRRVSPGASMIRGGTLRRLSTDGFEWGHGSTGQAQLARSLAADVLGDDRKALNVHQRLRFLSRVPHKKFFPEVLVMRSFCFTKLALRPSPTTRLCTPFMEIHRSRYAVYCRRNEGGHDLSVATRLGSVPAI